ncbi:exodeoxyribonuclease VII large subunit [Kineothrix sp. MB12-C1]|uniref:exodeoxyribonuclease VII large subunit n=1 Tax=Kineothrix sp. MB12-C1 TaxID=3070215 RepID=UPI0027D272F9|nr:exodeoxyribonuclease VII large subunit [Kineothrix sp. MB12-C1]WMC92937.1 exodeoxyribonuclease VII large subunit [Kineothrix sp. MB12-C1]
MQNVYTVAQINSYIKNMFLQDFMLQSVLIKGEVSNCKYHSSGHIYFTLKDEKGTISCVMFAGNRSGLAFRMQEGQSVIVGGAVDIYERDGKYQLYARQIMLDGSGLLHEKFERLKRELEERGMFDHSYKQTIPRYIRTLGVVTAATGAAVRDIINIASRRNPYVQIILYPAIVQGEQAPASIIKGIRTLERYGADVIIVGRGGGSIEDLWAFNEEAVAQAIFDCSVPIISAIGHETDTTIADYVSDLRAPTPSAAAELAVYEYRKYEENLRDYDYTLKRLFRNRINIYRGRLDNLTIKLKYLSPAGQIREKRTLALRLEGRLEDAIKAKVSKKRHRLDVYIERLKGLSPLDKLNQGFSYVSDEKGRTVTDVNKVDIGDTLQIHMKNGLVKATTTEKEMVVWEKQSRN